MASYISDCQINDLIAVVEELMFECFGSEKVKGPILKKQDGTTVSALDYYIEDRLKAYLFRRFPRCILISEESHRHDQCFRESQLIFILDPIDGTINYVSGFPLYGVSLGAYVIREQCMTPIFGLVALPAMNEIYYTTADFQVRRNNIILHNDRAIEPSQQEERPKLVMIDDYNLPSKLVSNAYVPGIRCTGSTAIDVLFVGLGISAGTIITSYLWDFAGAWPIARALEVKLWGSRDLRQRTEMSKDEFIVSPHEKKWQVREPLYMARENHLEEIRDFFENFRSAGK